MAFNEKALQIAEGAGSYGTAQTAIFRRATYITADAPAVVEAANYFNGAALRLPKNTLIEAVMTADGTPVHKTYVVTANTGTAVTIALQATTAG